MNQYERQAERQRTASMRFSMMLWSAGAGLIAIILTILGLSISAPREFWYKVAIAAAVLLLLLRQIARRLRVRNPRSAEPDPASRLNLD
ncbi:MAG TPA: hypothetical protein VH351_01105 [Bryobacteraceae bacterium]|jgi:hypothetical protein|nr:hypothetical protein [Bryobacteraceae bacterium]